jgi:hypothetical protein
MITLAMVQPSQRPGESSQHFTARLEQIRQLKEAASQIHCPGFLDAPLGNKPCRGRQLIDDALKELE